MDFKETYRLRKLECRRQLELHFRWLLSSEILNNNVNRNTLTYIISPKWNERSANYEQSLLETSAVVENKKFHVGRYNIYTTLKKKKGVRHIYSVNCLMEIMKTIRSKRTESQSIIYDTLDNIPVLLIVRKSCIELQTSFHSEIFGLTINRKETSEKWRNGWSL